jgi:hypothetical protein
MITLIDRRISRFLARVRLPFRGGVDGFKYQH